MKKAAEKEPRVWEIVLRAENGRVAHLRVRATSKAQALFEAGQHVRSSGSLRVVWVRKVKASEH